MPAGFRMGVGQVLGRSHALAGINCQDAMVSGTVEVNGDTVFYGVVCDGCSEGHDSEVGAKLAAAFIGTQMEYLVKSRHAFFRIPPILHKKVVEFLENLLGKYTFDSQEARVDFIKNKLLFTVVGFILSRDQLMVFAQGDGVIIVNDEVTVRNENDTPLYIGYNLVERKFLSAQASSLPTGFDVTFSDPKLVTRFAIASDSLGNELLTIPAIWGNPKRLSLQRKLNAWSWNDHLFKDDISLIVVERIPEGE